MVMPSDVDGFFDDRSETNKVLQCEVRMGIRKSLNIESKVTSGGRGRPLRRG